MNLIIAKDKKMQSYVEKSLNNVDDVQDAVEDAIEEVQEVQDDWQDDMQ